MMLLGGREESGQGRRPSPLATYCHMVSDFHQLSPTYLCWWDSLSMLEELLSLPGLLLFLYGGSGIARPERPSSDEWGC